MHLSHIALVLEGGGMRGMFRPVFLKPFYSKS